MNKKIGLVLQGGGALGAFTAGALSILVSAGLRFDWIGGTSVGALNGAFLAQYQKARQDNGAEALLSIWNGISSDQVYRKWYRGLLWFLPVLWKLSMFTTAPLRKLLERHYKPAKVKGSDVEVEIGAVSVHTGKRRVWTKEHLPAEAILASSAFPMGFEPVEVDGELYIDDGIREVAPLDQAIKAGCEEIWVVLNSPQDVLAGELPKRPRFWDLGLRILATMIMEIELNDLRAANFYNILAKGGHETDKKFVKIVVIQPAAPLGDPLDFGNKKAKKNIEKGKQAAIEVLKQHGL